MRRADVVSDDPRVAVDEVVKVLSKSDPALVLFFCSAEYPPEFISQEMGKHFNCPVIGCTSAGEIGTKFQKGGMVAITLPRHSFQAAVSFIPDLNQYTGAAAVDYIEELRERLGEDVTSENTFAFTLIDGLSVQEEHFVADTYGALKGISLIGGSAGDSLKFERTTVFGNDSFGSNAAVIALIKTDLPFEIFQHKHFVPSEIEMVITAADPATRTVFEIDGGPALDEYAALLGIEAEEVNQDTFSTHPVMLQVGDEWYVRSIQRVNDDKSLTFYCAIEEGIPLTIGEGKNFLDSLKEQVRELKSKYSEVEVTLGCDCILRRLAIEADEITTEVEEILSELAFIGFSTFGEQVNSLHVNQTLTGVIIGKR